jgi:hydroxyethylthiazole kinase-like uncharacterized protein yjeF
MVGAALLASRAALLCGAGRVYAGLLDQRIAVDPNMLEVMVQDPLAFPAMKSPACLVAGPGLGLSALARQCLMQSLATPHSLLLDADALNLLAIEPSLASPLFHRAAPTLITPHPGEATRLLGCRIEEIQADRPGCVAALSERFHAVAVLKGAGTLVRAPGSEAWLNTSGNPGMAAPGMGDVLCGIIAALIAQGLHPETAAVSGVWLHGAAGDAAVEEGIGPRGLTATELTYQARRLLNSLH